LFGINQNKGPLEALPHGSPIPIKPMAEGIPKYEQCGWILN